MSVPWGYLAIGVVVIVALWFRKRKIALIVVGIYCLAITGWMLDPRNHLPHSDHAGYVKALPMVDEPQDHTDEMVDRLGPVKAEANGYHGPIRLPSHWHHYQVTQSHEPGDWFTVWCNTMSEPRPIREAWGDISPDIGDYCFGPQDKSTTFFLQGHGSIWFRQKD
jgi:hypothetical protein